MAAALAFSLLNPQVYLEMMALVGAVAIGLPSDEKPLFAIGVAVVSPLWFFGLVAAGRCLEQLFVRPYARLALDGGTGLFMVVLAAAIVGAELGWPQH